MKRAAWFFLAAAFATVEYGMFVLFFIVIWGAIALWRSDDRRRFLRGALASAGWVVLFLALLWPAGVLNLNLLKSWVFVMYIALFRLGGEPVAFAGWWNLLIEKWNANPVELLLLLALLGATLWRWRALLRHGSLFAASGLIAALLYLQFNPTLVYRWYLFPAFAVAFLFLSHAWLSVALAPRVSVGKQGGASPLSPRGLALGSAAIAILLFLAAWRLVPEPDYSELRAIHAVVDRAAPTHLTIPRSVLPQLMHYHPDARIVSYHDVAYEQMSLADSIPRWRARGFVLVPADADLGDAQPDGTVGGYVWFGEVGGRRPETRQQHLRAPDVQHIRSSIVSR